MKIAVLTICIGDEYNTRWSSAIKTKEIYSRINNYDFIFIKESLDEERMPHWSKIKAIQKYLKDYDWIFYSDADVYIMNYDKKIEDIINNEYFFIISEDNNMINSGNFLIKNTPLSFDFLSDVYSQYPTHPIILENKVMNLNDQFGIYNCYKKEQYIEKVLIINQELINSYPCSCCGKKFKPNDFLIHFVNHKNHNFNDGEDNGINDVIYRFKINQLEKKINSLRSENLKLKSLLFN